MSANVQLTDQMVYLSGFIDFDNAETVYQQGIPLLKQYTSSDVIPVDLSALTSSNTISLAVFVQWLKVILPTRKIQLLNVPPKMFDIIQASNLQAEFSL
jgi:phospholipid transport system transporter-binding protein